jgi:hypothetical protein
MTTPKKATTAATASANERIRSRCASVRDGNKSNAPEPMAGIQTMALSRSVGIWIAAG